MGAGASTMPPGNDVADEAAKAASTTAGTAENAVETAKVVADGAAGAVVTASASAVASTSEVVDAAADKAQKAAEAVAATTGEAAADAAAQAATAAQEAAAATGEAAAGGMNAFLAAVPEAAKEEAAQVVRQLGDKLSEDQMKAAAATLTADLQGLGEGAAAGGASVLAAVGGALAQAGEMAPDVVESLSAALSTAAAAIGPALGPIGVSVGLLGALVSTFLQSKENDKNVSTVSLWAASVKDWLLMVTGKVEKSAFSSTMPLFEGLQNEIKGMFGQIDKHNKKWRFSKMISSSTFKRDFDRAKTAVLELKGALHAFLDQEMQDAQEKKLAEVAQSAIEVSAKLDTMDAQLSEIREMLAAANKKDPATAQLDEESLIYAQIQQASDRTGDLPFKVFVPTFEMFFFDNKDLDKAQIRALKIALDKENTGVVNKPHFIKFFRAWKESNMPMQDYMQKLADEAPPTLFAEGVKIANKAAEAVSDKAAATKEAAAAKAAAAKEGIAGIKSGLFGSKKKDKEAKEEAA